MENQCRQDCLLSVQKLVSCQNNRNQKLVTFFLVKVFAFTNMVLCTALRSLNAFISIVFVTFQALTEIVVDMVADKVADRVVDKIVHMADYMTVDTVVYRVVDRADHKVDCRVVDKVGHKTDHRALNGAGHKIVDMADHKASDMVDHRVVDMADHMVVEDNSEIDIALIQYHSPHNLVFYLDEDHDVTPERHQIPTQSLV